jgi:hypothetical protein
MEKKATSEPDISAEITKNTNMITAYMIISGPITTELKRKNKLDKLSG